MKDGAKREQIDVKELHERLNDLLAYMYMGVIVELIKDGKVIADIFPTRREEQITEESDHIEKDEYNMEQTRKVNDDLAWEDLKRIAKELDPYWPEGVSAVDAVRDARRDL